MTVKSDRPKQVSGSPGHGSQLGDPDSMLIANRI